MNLTEFTIGWTERGWLPDGVARLGIRRLLRDRLAAIRAGDCEAAAVTTRRFVREMNRSAIAPVPEKPNQQHYELPAEFFGSVLGPQRKYSSCYWGSGAGDLAGAEEAALRITAQRAGVKDGMRVLELGCGWGSLTLWMARHFPDARIVAVSNSASQRHYIDEQAAELGLDNVSVVTADMNAFEAGERFDRIVSVEMFEHMHNHRELLRRIAGWLEPDGRLFVHMFCHRSTPYAFVPSDASDWMSRYFFSGGIMPSDALPNYFQEHLRTQKMWRWSGRHYRLTADAWLANLDARRDRVLPILESAYGTDAALWLVRWRIFFMACSELFGYSGGQEWWVSHYLLGHRPR